MAIASLKASAPVTRTCAGFPLESNPETSVSEHSVVRMMKLHIWGTSTSTYSRINIVLIVSLFKELFFFLKRFVSTIYCTHFAGDFGAALVVGGSGYAVQRLSVVVVHKAPEVLEALGH